MILVTGASGLLGANLVLTAREWGEEVVATYHRHTVYFKGTKALAADLTIPAEADALLQSVRPDWVVHCAAATDVDWCQDHAQEAHRINAEAPRHVAATARRVGARLLYVSTDAVFDGARGNYVETDTPAPVNVYGASKWAGERAVRDAMPTALLVRTNLYGWNVQDKQSMAEWILARLKSGRAVPGFQDVIFTPILVDDLSGILLDMMDGALEGLYHVAGSEALSKFEFARQLANVFGFDRQSVYPVSVATSGLRAPRPLDTSLGTEKVRRALGRPLPDVDAGLRRFKAARDSGYVRKLRACRGG